MFANVTYHFESYTYPAVQPEPVSLNVTLCHVAEICAIVVVPDSVTVTVFAEPRPLKVATNKLAETNSAATIMVAKIGRMPLLDWPLMPLI
jgi:hypothetical protein